MKRRIPKGALSAERTPVNPPVKARLVPMIQQGCICPNQDIGKGPIDPDCPVHGNQPDHQPNPDPVPSPERCSTGDHSTIEDHERDLERITASRPDQVEHPRSEERVTLWRFPDAVGPWQMGVPRDGAEVRTFIPEADHIRILGEQGERLHAECDDAIIRKVEQAREDLARELEARAEQERGFATNKGDHHVEAFVEAAQLARSLGGKEGLSGAVSQTDAENTPLSRPTDTEEEICQQEDAAAEIPPYSTPLDRELLTLAGVLNASGETPSVKPSTTTTDTGATASTADTKSESSTANPTDAESVAGGKDGQKEGSE